MSDCCRGGMRLICDRFIEPGSDVVIRSGDRLSNILNGSVHGDRLAEVIWCQRCDKEKPHRFLIGLQFVRPSAH